MLIPFGILGASGAGAAEGYELIQTVTSSSTSVTFSSIPAGYKHLQIRVSGRFANGSVNKLIMRFNGDTGSNYAWHQLYVRGSVAGVNTQGATTQDSLDIAEMYGAANESTPVIIDILDALNTAKNKTTRSFGGTINTAASSETYIYLKSGLWLNTAAINSITLTTAGGVSFSNTRFSLYGIAG